jgi:hypothetical protein
LTGHDALQVMAAKRKSDRIRERVLREWRGVDEPLDMNAGMHVPAETIDSLLLRLGLQDGFDEEQVKRAWRELAGDFIASHSAPESIQRGELVLRVTQPAMRFHLEQIKPMLMKRIGGLLGEGKVRTIRFKHG